MSSPTLNVMEKGIIPLEIPPAREVEIVQFLGGGGQALVFKVRDTATGKLYSLKLIQGLKPGSVLAKRARLEASVSIPSDYIVPVYGLREWDPHTCLILFEYFPSTSLDKLLEARRLPAEWKRAIMMQTLLGVADAHRSNIVHRDLKPHNILIGEGGQTKLIDFGISKFKGSGLTVSGDVIGTIHYMAPELLFIDSKIADARADIYSLGQIIYELSMGEHFWVRKGWREVSDFVSFLAREPMPEVAVELHDFLCDFHPDVARVLPRMLMTNRDERWESVDEILSELGHVPEIVMPPADLDLRSPLLIVESGSNKGARSVLGLAEGEKRELGRFDLAGSDDSIGRKHLEVARRGNSYFVRDLGSKNGTMIHGVALEPNGKPVELKHADRIKVGDVFLRFAFLKH